MGEMIERVAKALYSEDPENWDDALRIVNGTFGGEGFMQKNHPDTQARYKEDMDEARDKARRVIQAMREPTEDMLDAAAKMKVPGCKPWLLDDWRRMVDGALALPRPTCGGAAE
jgi:hypothetical protein